MKKLIKLLGITVLAAIIGFSFAACGDGAGGGNITPPETIKGIGPGAWTYVLDISSIAKSAHSVAPGSNYELKVVTPIKGSNGFDTDTIIVTVANIEENPGGKIKLTLVPVSASDKDKYGDSFEVTLDEKGDMYKINGLKGIPPGALIPIGDNSDSLDGAWFMWFTDSSDDLCSSAMIINENVLAFTTNKYTDHTAEEIIEVWSQRCKLTFLEDAIACSDWEEWYSELGEWVADDSGDQPEYLEILDRTPTTLRVDGVENEAEGGQATMYRVTTE